MRKILLFIFSCAVSLSAMAQERTVTGRVTSTEDGSALPGVNVVVKGTTIGTVTNANGDFTLNVKEGSVLTFTFIGLKSMEVEVGNRSTFDIQMTPDVQQLSEVVVTGYGVQEKRTLTGSISSVKGSAIQNLPVQSLDRALQGRAAGVQIGAASGAPGGALNVRVRGIGSINGSNDPLYIIDGVQINRFGQSTQGSSNPLSAINPNDIESIEVLKDAAAAAIYGAQAANGVVIVTTKKGKGKTQVDFTVQRGAVQPLNLYKMMDGRQFAQFRADVYANSGLNVQSAYDTYGNPNDDNLTNTDWVDAVFRTGQLASYDISMSGGDDKTSFLFSGSYQMQEGQVIMSEWKRGTMRLNLSHKPSSKVTIGANMNISYVRNFGTIADGNFVNGPFQAGFSAQPTTPIRLPDGRWAPYPLSGSGHLFGYNIVQGLNEEVRMGRVPQTVYSVNASYEIIPGLTLNGLAGVDASFGTDNNQRPGSIPVFAGGQMAVTSRRTISWNANTTLNYNKKFADIHSVSAIAGFEYLQMERGGVTASQFTFPNPALRLLSQGATNRPATEFFFDMKRQGVFGKVNYALKDRYIADFTLRRDGSSRFGPQTRYGTFWAGSLAYRISEESFLDGLTFLDDLKIRASYGKVGNSEIADYDWFTSYGSPAGTQYLGLSVLRLGRLGNDQITWEEETQRSVGVDFALFGGRVFGSAEYYNNLTEGQLLDVALPWDSGLGSIRGNEGSIVNRGFDVELGGTVLDQGGFKWVSSFNISTLRNEVVSLPGDRKELILSDGRRLIKGQPMSVLYLFEYAGVNPATGKAMIYDTLGNLAYQGAQRDAAVRGTPIPKWFGGWTNTFSFKGLTLEVFFQYQGGNHAFNGDLYNIYSTAGANNQMVEALNHWRQPGDITNLPRPTSAGTINGLDQRFGTFGTTQFMSDAGYIRLKQVTLSYNLPRSFVSKAHLNKVNVFVQGMNLWTATKYFGIDPEVVTNNNMTNTSSFGVFPVGRQISGGITVGF